MAFANKIIRNPVTKQDIIFIQTKKDTGGKCLEMQTTYHAQSKEPIAHYHPYQREDFMVVSGTLQVKMNNELKTYQAGETFHVPANTVHAMWNSSNNKTVVNWKVQPAMDTEYMFENTFGLASEGKVGPNGAPGILQIAPIISKYHHVFRLAKPPYIAQKIIFTILRAFSWLAGYRSSYKKYID